MVARKHFGDNREAAFDYLSIGRNMLAQLVAGMAMNGLQVLSRSVTLPNGVGITVSSVFGQHDIRIEAPPDVAPEIAADVQAVGEVAQKTPPFEHLSDVVKLSGSIMLTLNERIGTGAPGTPGSGLNERVTCSTSLRITLITANRPTYTPPPTPPQIFIGGVTSRGGDAFVWDDVNGYTTLALGNTSQRRNPKVLGFSPNGAVIVGSLDVLDGNGYYPLAAKWQSTRNEAQVVNGHASTGVMQRAWQATNDGNTVLGVGIAAPGNNLSSWHFEWGGQNNQSPAIKSGTISAQGLTSPDGRVKVSNQTLQQDGGPWISWGPNSPLLTNGQRQAPSDAVAACVMYNPYTPPAPPDPTYTTTVLVFSA